MPKITGCCVDGTNEYCIDCLHKNNLDECHEYRKRYNGKCIWDDN